jgi:hypothetical protein
MLTCRLVVNSKDLALCVRGVSSVRALEIHLLRCELNLSGIDLRRGPGRLPRLALGSSGRMHFTSEI